MSRVSYPNTLKLPQIQDALELTGDIIKEARKARGWSQAELGGRLGDVDRRLVAALEKGKPNVDIALLLGALWLLDLPIMATLSSEKISDQKKLLMSDVLTSLAKGGISNVSSQRQSRLGVRAAGTSARADESVGRPTVVIQGRKKVINNDF